MKLGGWEEYSTVEIPRHWDLPVAVGHAEVHQQCEQLWWLHVRSLPDCKEEEEEEEEDNDEEEEEQEKEEKEDEEEEDND